MLVLDIGGSFIKYGLTDDEGRLLPGTASQVPSDANGSYENFLAVLSKIIENAKSVMPVTKACVCIPGPFDYANGVSRMQHKFTALYQKTIKPPFDDAGVEVAFIHDSTAFLLGEGFDGSGDSPCGVMLGTGLGFAFAREGRVCVDENQTPAFILWNMPWKDGIAEDYVSQRAILKLFGNRTDSVKAIADAARAGDAMASQVFLTVGENLSGMLQRIIPLLGCDSLVLGGQIAKSADLFHLQIPVPWRVCEHPEESALYGAGRHASLGREKCIAVMNRIQPE